MTELLPKRSPAASARRLVVKVGSRLIADSPAGRPAAIADEVWRLRESGREVVVVSSGAIALGMRVLGLSVRPRALPMQQAAAAVGQNRLMQNWEHGFAAHGIRIAQVLLTHDDMADRRRFLNARHSLRSLVDAGVIPIVNENDTVAVEEIKYGDNDLLAALVCNLITADLLVMLTDVDGLLAQDGGRIAVVRDIDREAAPLAGATEHGGVGSGGMASKVQAAKAAARHGVASAVANGTQAGILARLLAGEDVGTLFLPSEERFSSRKHWIAYSSKPTGRIVVDSGAYAALTSKKKSLLPAGILEVVGGFGLGDVVSLVTAEGTEFARGLVGYSADDLRRIRGLQTTDIEPTLGYKYLDEAIHRDDLVLL
jgi:glutamate 5-kinase